MTDPITTLAWSYGIKSFAELIRALSERVLQNLSGKALRISTKILTRYNTHLEATYNRCIKMKSILYRDEPVSLLGHYVSPNLSCGEWFLDSETLINQISSRR